MNTDEAKGTVQKLAGKAQGVLGVLAGDDEQRAKGHVREAAGSLQEGYGEASDALSDFIKRRPGASLAIAAGVTFVVSLFFRRR
jgi:uncharacterized protein YjbJ (UPF0337 family)